MRIEAYTQVQQIYQTQKTRQTAKTTAAKASDQLQISSIGKEIQTAKAAVAGAPDIREDLTSSIKSQIQDGTYEVSNDSFADKLLERYSAMAI